MSPSNRAGWLGEPETLERVTPPASCRIHLADGNDRCTAWVRGCTPGVRERLIPTPGPAAADPSVGLRFLEAARVELTGLLESGGETAIMELAPGSHLSFPRSEPQLSRARPRTSGRSAAPLSARLVDAAKGTRHIAFADEGPSGIALGLRAGEILRTALTLTAPRDAKPGTRIALDLLQRDAEGTVVGGVSVAVMIVARKPKRQTKTARAEPARNAKTRRTRS